jgi:MSHA biogenesis protein MshN
MSLINKMLQDLDARGGTGDAAVRPQDLKAVPAPERDRRPLLLAGAGVVAVALAAGGWYGWQYWQSHRAAPGPVPNVVINQIPPGARIARASDPAPVAESSEPAAPTTASQSASPPNPQSGSAPGLKPEPTPAPAQPAVVASATPAASAAPASAASASASASGPSPGDETAALKPRRGASEAAPLKPRAERKQVDTEGVSRRELTPKLESDGAYRRALAALQEGRLSVALADLERAIEIDPRNEAARQTYVSLLLEGKRPDEAIRQLRLSLGIDPRQPGLAMVLARLQLERGGPALDTLMKTLPSAGGNADYQAFLAGVLQREQRHADAARYYREALRLSPNNGVWWMGLGISLQAEQHLPEARDAYTRARAAAGMTPELLAFLDRKLEQLAR